LIVVGLAALAYQGDEAHEPRERRGHWSYSRDDILREAMALPTVVGIAAIAGIVMLVRPSPWPSGQGCATQTSK